MKKRLATFDIGTRKVTVYLDSALLDTENWGETHRAVDGSSLSIHLRPNMPSRMFWVTFWHEVAHCAESEHCLDIPHPLIDAFGHWMETFHGSLKWYSKVPPMKKKK